MPIGRQHHSVAAHLDHKAGARRERLARDLVLEVDRRLLQAADDLRPVDGPPAQSPPRSIFRRRQSGLTATVRTLCDTTGSIAGAGDVVLGHFGSIGLWQAVLRLRRVSTTTRTTHEQHHGQPAHPQRGVDHREIGPTRRVPGDTTEVLAGVPECAHRRQRLTLSRSSNAVFTAAAGRFAAAGRWPGPHSTGSPP